MNPAGQISDTAVGARSWRLSPAALQVAAATPIAGCAGSGADGSASAGLSQRSAVVAKGPIPAGKARVIITRPSSIVYAAAPASIPLNGAKVADFATGSSATIDVPAGASALSVSA